MSPSVYRKRLCELAVWLRMERWGGVDGVQGEVGHRAPVVEFQEWKLSWSLDLNRELTAEVIERFSEVMEAEGRGRHVCV